MIRSVFILQGKIKAKRLQSMITSLRDTDLGVYNGGEYKTAQGINVKMQSKLCSELAEGLNSETVVLGRVVGSVLTAEAVPL